MERMQAAKAIQEQMQAAHRLWDAYREQGGDPADLVDEARGWREKSGEVLQVVMQDGSVGESFMKMTEGPARLNNPFELFKVGLELLDALMRDLGVEAGAAAAAAAPAPSASPAASAAKAPDAAPAVETHVAASATTKPAGPKAPTVQASVGIASKVAPGAPPTKTPASAPEMAAASRATPEISKTLAEVRIAIEMTDLPHGARQDHLVQLTQLEKVFAADAATRDVALGRSAIRSLTHAADRVPNIASRLMTLLDVLLA